MNKLLIVHQMSVQKYETLGFLDARTGKPERTPHMPVQWQAAYAKGYQDGLKPQDEEDEDEGVPF